MAPAYKLHGRPHGAAFSYSLSSGTVAIHVFVSDFGQQPPPGQQPASAERLEASMRTLAGMSGGLDATLEALGELFACTLEPESPHFEVRVGPSDCPASLL